MPSPRGATAQAGRAGVERPGQAHVNACEQGLAAYVHTLDLDRALRVGQALDVGMVAVNRGRVSSVAAPFGGAKGSGWGRAGGPDALRDYLETRYLAVGRAA